MNKWIGSGKVIKDPTIRYKEDKASFVAFTMMCKRTDTGAAGSTYSPNFGNIAAGTGVTTIPEILKELFLAPVTGVTHTGGFWINNEGERLPFVGGCCNNASNAGPSALLLSNERSIVWSNLGFFSAYMEL